MIDILLGMILAQLLWSVLILLLPKGRSSMLAKAGAAVTMVLTAAVAYLYFTAGAASLSSSYAYSSSLGIAAGFQLNEVTLILIVMTSVIFFAASFVGDYFIGRNDKLYNFLFAFMEATSLGVFLSSSLIFFYVFWEVTEIAMFFIILLYGGIDRKYAAIKFLIYSIISSLLLLIGIMALYHYSAAQSFSIQTVISSGISAPAYMQALIFLVLLIAFMIKVPVFPFHTWLPAAHTEAPATGSMILAGVMLKFGAYGLLLLFSIMSPITAFAAPYLAILFAFSSIYGAFTAIKMSNLKRMVAYTSIADMGIVSFAMVALNQAGTIGAAYGMLSHGIAISLLFMLAGTFDKEFGTLQIERLGGILRWSAPAAYLFIFGIFAVIGIPLTAGFIADVLMFIGSTSTFGILGIAPLLSIVIVGAYLLWLAERSILGGRQSIEGLTESFDRSVRNSALVLASAAVILGVLPFLLLSI